MRRRGAYHSSRVVERVDGDRPPGGRLEPRRPEIGSGGYLPREPRFLGLPICPGQKLPFTTAALVQSAVVARAVSSIGPGNLTRVLESPASSGNRAS